ncbi:ankyrin repeat-containing domain protein [Xylaria digitata]|nr:ankyrin repeat-containing domain protein [Xylaria digitata]
MVQGLRHPSTGLWFIESDDFKEWRATPGSKLWVTGIPGAGKSVLAGLILYECMKLSSADDRKATTYFFCTYRNKATHSVRNLISSVAAQLARQNEEAFRILEKYQQELVSQKPLATEPSLPKLLTVFEAMCRMFDQVFVVVDGLDECETDEVVCSLSQLSLKINSASIATLLLSRDVVHIRDRLELNFGHTEIEAHTEDIQLYVLAELERRIESKQLRLRNSQLKAEIVDRFVHGAKGMFRWVACQLDYLGELPTDRERRNALSKLPPTLPATYERILMKIEKSGAEVRRLVQKTLLLIRASLCDVGYLSEAVAIRDDSNVLTEEDIVDEYEIMLRCSSLIRKSADGTRLEFSHFTVQEFLEDLDPAHATLGIYRVSDARAQVALAEQRNETRPFYRRCAIHWVECVTELADTGPDGNGTKIDAMIMELIQTLFESRKTAHFCQWAVEFVDAWMSDNIIWNGRGSSDNGKYNRRINLPLASLMMIETDPEEKDDLIKFVAAIIRPDFTPLHMASLLGLPSLCDHLLKHGAKVNLSSRFGTPLHCALGGIVVFLRNGNPINRRITTDRVGRVRRPLVQDQIVRLLLAAGASAAQRLSTPFQQRTLIGTMRLSPMALNTLALFPDLLRAGLIIEEEDLDSMETWLGDYGFTRGVQPSTHDKSIVVALLRDLKGTNDSGGDLVKRLYSIIYRHAKNLIWDLDDLSSGDSETRGILKLIIVSNDIIALEKMLNGNQQELSKNPMFQMQGEEWTAVQLACYFRSLDVLDRLLDIGADPESTTHQGRKLTHLINTAQDGEDTLRILLQHQVSTTAVDDDLYTIWHRVIANSHIQALKLLISLASDKNEALQVVSGSGQTAICFALDKQNEEAITLLLDHYPIASFWKSNVPLYRLAAQLGSLEVVNKLLDIGIEPDEFDDELGSPLHHIPPMVSVPCVKVLVETFPHCYRRRKDGHTPFQSFIEKVSGISCREDIEIQPQVLCTLFPAFEPWQQEAAVEAMADIWRAFYGFTAIHVNLKSAGFRWAKQILTYFIDAGLMISFEENDKVSTLVLFATRLDETLCILSLSRGAMRQDQLRMFNGGEWERLKNWDFISWILLELTSKTAFRDSATEHDSVTRLLFEAILHDDYDLIKRLLQNGVDVHRRVNSISALELAGPGLPIVHLLASRTLVHQERIAWKLRLVLEAGANANSVSKVTYYPALKWHLIVNSILTAKVLLQFGADPWLVDTDGNNAALVATVINNSSFLKLITEHSASHKLATKWDQTWRDFTGRVAGARVSGGNAFHLAASCGSLDCMEMFLHEKWLFDLESVDDDLQTPMHYAALSGQSSIIRFLFHHGCDINRTTRGGKSPLHLAVERQRLYAVQELLDLGAEVKADAHGLSPAVYAYRTGNFLLMGVLRDQNKEDRNKTFQQNGKDSIYMAEAFYVALNEEDLDACERFITKGMSSRIVEWLLGKGAKVSIVFKGRNMPKYATALKAAIAKKNYNRLLPTLIRRYLEEGGDFRRQRQTPLHVVVQRDNYKGLRVLLKELRQISYNIKDVVNQKTDPGNSITALHLAAYSDSLDAATLLIKNGANLEVTDSEGSTPLHYAAENGSIHVLKLLIKHGACVEPLALAELRTPLMITCSRGHVGAVTHILRLGQNITEDSRGRNLVDITVQGDADEYSQLKLCAMLFHRGFDLHRLEIDGECALFNIMESSRHWVLRHVLREYPLSLRIQDLKWSSRWIRDILISHRESLTNVTKAYRLVHRYLGREEPLKVSDSVAVGKSSLLYLAASTGHVTAVDDLLSVGIDIEVRVCDEGTALTVAAAHGQLDVVKYLAKITNADPNLDMETKQVREWTGIIQIGLPLKWEWKKRRIETMLQYAKRSQEILKALRGEVMNPVSEGRNQTERKELSNEDESSDGDGSSEEGALSDRDTT